MRYAMSAARSTAEVRELERRISSSLENVGCVAQLTNAVLSSDVDGATHLAAIHALRRVFTQFCHDGLLSGSKAARSAAGKKKSSGDIAKEAAADALSSWLKQQFGGLLDALVHFAAHAEVYHAKKAAKAKGGDAKKVDPVDLAVAAVGTVMHFAAHAVSEEQQREDNGNHFCGHVVQHFLRVALSYDTAAASSEAGSAAPAAAAAPVPPAVARALGNALHTFRVSYVDDYDDVRFAALKAVAALAREKGEKQAAASARAGAAAGGAAASAGASAYAIDSGAFDAVSAATFARNAVEFLLSVSLPVDQEEWDASDHELYVRSQWEPLAPELYGGSAAASSAAAAAAPAKSGAKLYTGDSSDDEDAAPRGASAAAAGGGLNANGKRPRPPPLSSAPVASGSLSDGLGPATAQGAAAKRARAAGAASAGPSALAAAARALVDPYGGDDDDDDDDELGLNIRLGPTPAEAAAAAAAKAAAAAAAAAASGSSWTAPKCTQLVVTRKAYAEAWLAVLRLPLAPDTTRRVLAALATDILPSMPKRQALQLADFLTRCTDGGGVLALLALQSLFHLMQHHGLEYPRFYAKLYALFNDDNASAKHRARFFTLLDMFLSSAVLPAYLVAAFMKRAARLALRGGAPVAAFALPFIYNCLKRHPACTPLVHRASSSSTAAAAAAGGGGGGAAAAAAWPAPADPFDDASDDPAACRALESSLWELPALQQHYVASAAHLARVLNKTAAKQEFDIKREHASTTYASLVEAEVERTYKRGGETVPVEVPFAFGPVPTILQLFAGPAAAEASAAGTAAAAGAGAGDAAAPLTAVLEF